LKEVTFLFDSEQGAEGDGATVWILDRDVEKADPLDPFGQGIVRRLLGRNLGVDQEQIVISRNAFGRPVLSGETGVDFNVAHGGKVLVVGLSRGGVIGVDVEIVGQVQGIDLTAVARDHFSQIEMRWINSAEGDEQMSRFFLCWTAKEALVKAIGCGLSFPLTKIETTATDGGGLRIVRPGGWELVQREVDVGGNAAVVAVVVGGNAECKMQNAE
jgi:phosphopantetheinyl transferase